MERKKDKILGKATISAEKCGLEILDCQDATTSYIVGQKNKNKVSFWGCMFSIKVEKTK